jgi:hypothetical protein
MVLQRFFVVMAKGKKGKHRTPFLQLETAEGEKLVLHLSSPSELSAYNIDDSFTVVVGGGLKQAKLPGTEKE